MKNEPPENENYIAQALQRARRRKSAWNFLLVPFVFAGVAAIACGLFFLMWGVHVAIFPAHADRLGDFWGRGIGVPAFLSSFLLLVPLLFAAVPLGMMCANALVWLVPPARRALHREAEGIKGVSFAESMAGLWRISRIMVPVCLLLSLAGAATLTNLR